MFMLSLVEDTREFGVNQVCYGFVCLFDLILYVPVNNFF